MWTPSTLKVLYTTSAASVLAIVCILFVGLIAADGRRYANDNGASSSLPAVAKLTFCGDASKRDTSRRLVYVSTLDGTVTALDLTAAGRRRWSLSTGSAPLLSSSIHRFELTNDGRMVRMIPSLYGGLYKFDGDSIEQIPVTADHLLSSSFKFSEDLVISGGKETRSYGVSARTGRIVYECTMSGCRNHTEMHRADSSEAAADDRQRNGPPLATDDGDDEHDPAVDDIVVVRRETQTVRAVEPRTGGERWNFSVGHHELELLRPHDCQQSQQQRRPTRLSDDDDDDDGADDDDVDENDWHNDDNELAAVELRVLVPDGLICAVRRDDPTVVLWQHKFEHPIVNAWRTNAAGSALETINLFGAQQFPLKQPQQKQPGNSLHPSVYVGMYQRQLYIQESDQMRRTMLGNQLEAIGENPVKIPWKPQYALAAIEGNGGAGSGRSGGGGSEPSTPPTTSMSIVDVDDDRATALSVLYATEYVNGNGFFLYTAGDLNQTTSCKRNNWTTDPAATADDDADDQPYPFPFADDDTPTKIIIVSLWYWWKEIMVISLTTALVLNVVLSRRLQVPPSREVVIVERHVEIQVPVPMAVEAIDHHQQQQQQQQLQLHHDPDSGQSAWSARRSLSESSETFVSRYASDFDMVQCLGRGGFGVVFESKNKLDDCRYAIKRIQLPNRQESRDRVMREVKTLAHCEHQNIVRYFQAWVETPPAGWQEREDKVWMEREAMSHSVDIFSPSAGDECDDDDEEMSSMMPPSLGIGEQQHSLASPLPRQPSVVFSRVINRRERGLDAWITDLHTNECLNFDENNRKTSILRTDDEDDEDDEDDSEDDSFIQFRNDDEISQSATDAKADTTVDIVFTDEDADETDDDDENGNEQKVPSSANTTNNSFRIVFQQPVGAAHENGSTIDWSRSGDGLDDETTTEDDTTSGYPCNETNNADVDSFRIEFKHSSGSSGANGDGAAVRNASALPRALLASVQKQRTYSDSIIDSASNAAELNGTAADVGKAVKTSRHRRPLSLDLTAGNRRKPACIVIEPAAALAEAAAAVSPVCTNRMYLYIQMQLCKKQSLKDWLRLNDLATRQRDIVPIFRQIVDGVEYCHLKGLIHRDLKPGNIFFALDGQIKIGDFGLVTGMSTADMPNTPLCGMGGGVGGGGCAKHTQQVGTTLYMSPEQLKGEQYSYKVDVFSLGLIFFELLRVFGTEMERIETLKALRLGVFPDDFAAVFPDEHNLLRLMLSESPDERPTTIGIKARRPLGNGDQLLDVNPTSCEWHFALPPRRRDSHISGSSSSVRQTSVSTASGSMTNGGGGGDAPGTHPSKSHDS